MCMCACVYVCVCVRVCACVCVCVCVCVCLGPPRRTVPQDEQVMSSVNNTVGGQRCIRESKDDGPACSSVHAARRCRHHPAVLTPTDFCSAQSHRAPVTATAAAAAMPALSTCF
ncbi:unnamed protein product [Gadus morhua 'NCC']